MFCPYPLWRKESRLFWWEGEWIILRSFSNMGNTLKIYFNKGNAFSAFSRRGGALRYAESCMSIYLTSQTGTLCTLSGMQAAEKGHMKEFEKILKTAVRQQTKGTHWKFKCLCGILTFWQTVKCSWGAFSSDFSDHLCYSAWIGLDFSHCKFSAKQPTSAEPALLLRHKSSQQDFRPSERVSQQLESWHKGIGDATDTNSS